MKMNEPGTSESSFIENQKQAQEKKTEAGPSMDDKYRPYAQIN